MSAATIAADAAAKLSASDLSAKGGFHSLDDHSPIEVSETHQIPPPIEQAAMLYSMEQSEAAAAVLEDAIQQTNLGRFAPRAWGMLFELYQVLRRQADFERLAGDYAAKFESSPPAWTAGEAVASKPVATGPVVKRAVVLTGLVSAKSQETLAQVAAVAAKNPVVRIDVTKVTDIDDVGCALMNNVILQLKRARKDCVVAGADRLAAILTKRLVPGERAHDQGWLLLLEVLQQKGDQAAFEEAAVNYAVTFEVSPPSFVAPKAQPAAAVDKPEAEAEDTDDETCVLEGVVTSSSTNAFAFIRAAAETAAEVVVDVSGLKRMDFVAATNLMNIVGALAAKQKRVRLVKASHLVTALWEVIGLGGLAQIETRKT